MSLSLREQLLAAGLVSEKKAKQAELQQSQQQYKQGKNKVAQQRSMAPPPPNLAAQKALAEKAARDKELNRKKEEKAQRRARAIAINQLVEQNRIPRVEDENAEFYNFVEAGKIHRIAVAGDTRERIVRGDLIVARFRGFYALVTKEAGEKIRAIEATAVLDYKAESQAVDDNDPYKDFVVPDDLKW
jgi:uncharacterized protein YaiL (DUF2058 family)